MDCTVLCYVDDSIKGIDLSGIYVILGIKNVFLAVAEERF